MMEPTEIILNDATDPQKETIAGLVQKIIVLVGEHASRGGLRKVRSGMRKR